MSKKKHILYAFDEEYNEWLLLAKFKRIKKAKKMLKAGINMGEMVVLATEDMSVMLPAHSTDVKMFPQ